MSSTWGNQIKISVFGESHGAGIGVVLDGLPAGARIDLDAVLLQMARRAPGNDPAATRNDLDIALRVASDIPNEVVFIMCRCIELMKEVVDKGDDLTACSALAAVHLSVAAIRCMQAELLSYAKEMDDDVFGYTIVREAELNLANHQELIDGLVEELTRRLTREKK